MTYKEREIETIRRLREEIEARRGKTQPEWMLELNSKGELIQLDEVAELICEVQA